MSGALCVMTPGEVLMLLWCVGSWTIPLNVSSKKDGKKYIFFYVLMVFNCIMPIDAVGLQNAVFGAGVGPIHINNIDCRGDEDNLLECSHSSALSCYRGHSEDAGVRCQGII